MVHVGLRRRRRGRRRRGGRRERGRMGTASPSLGNPGAVVEKDGQQAAGPETWLPVGGR